MISAENQVRVFISSTFRDMHAERDHLVTVVFPELRERVEQLGLEFFDVDLRWGVPAKDADGETANSWEYCRQWIDRVEPFFICILGQRYGWVPEPEQLKGREDSQRQQMEHRSITDLEVHHAVLNTKLKRRSYFYLRATDAPETASDYVDPLPLSRKLEQLKKEVRACGRPVRDYPCKWTGSGFAGLDEFGRRVLDDLWSGVLRDERHVSKELWSHALGADPDSDARYTDESKPVPSDLAEKLLTLAKPAPLFPLDAEKQQMEAFAQARLRWFQGRTNELKQLTDFINSTDEKSPRLATVVAVPGQGKSALLAKLWQEISSPEEGRVRSPLRADSGVSAETTTEERRAQSNAPYLIAHFVGATERSASARNLVERLLGELDRSGITWRAEPRAEDSEPKRDFNSLSLRLAQRLGDYAGERRIVILLDALNQLSDGHDLQWLPIRLGSSVRVIVSCVEDASEKVENRKQKAEIDQSRPTSAATAKENEQHVLNALDLRQLAPLGVSLGPLTEDNVRTIVVAYLAEYCHELDREHLDTLCVITQARNPLYLLVMLNELRTLGGKDLNRIVPARIASMPQDHPDTVSLFRWVLQRLEVFGPEAVRWWCLYLAHCRVGMASHELADLLARKLGADAAATALRIERGMRRYLQRRGPQLDFFHGQLRQAVLEQYGPQIEAATVHDEMADYFTACAKGTDPGKEWETDSVRGFAECVFHLIMAGQRDRAAGLLSSFPFLLHKLRVGLLGGVFEDYEIIRSESPLQFTKRMKMWADFFLEKAHILRRGNEEWPAHKILLQLAVEHADDSPLAIGAEQWMAEGRCDWFWLRRVPRLAHSGKNPCLAVLEGHTHTVTGALALADGRLLSWAGGLGSNDHDLRWWDGHSGANLRVLSGHTAPIGGALELADGRLLSWSTDTTLRLWDGRSGECLAVLQGHAALVSGALELADGRLLSWAMDDTLRLWDGRSGACLAVLTGHTRHIGGARALAGGRLLSCGRWDDKTLRLWDDRSGDCLAVLAGHALPVTGELVLADGRLLSWALDNTLRLWDVQSGICLVVLEGHTDRVSGALALENDRLLSWSWDKTLRLWDGRSGACLAVLEGHTHHVTGTLALPEGRLLSWAGGFGSEDRALRLWDGESGACLAVLAGHTGQVRGALALADRRLVSWSMDKTLRLWDGQSGACLAELRGHTGGVDGALALGDERLVSWAGWPDKTLRLWSGQSGACLALLQGHSNQIEGVIALADGRLLSWALDDTLRLWDGQSRTCLPVHAGHSGNVRGVNALVNGRLVSWAGPCASEDHALRLWDCQSGVCLAVLEGHSWTIEGVLALADGRLLSWTRVKGSGPIDSAIRLWDGQSGACLAVLHGHTGSVGGALALADGRLLSWSLSELCLWDGQSGACLAVLQGGTPWKPERVEGALALSDGRLLSWSSRGLRLWDGQSGACLAVLKGHTESVKGALALADGRLLSWAGNELRLWDGQSGGCLAVLEGHTHRVTDTLVLADGQLLSWAGEFGSEDQALRLWDGQSGACLALLIGHTGLVGGGLALADGRLLSWAKDETLRLWDGQSGECIEVVAKHELAKLHPELLHAWEKALRPESVCLGFLMEDSSHVGFLLHRTTSAVFSAWHAEAYVAARCLLPDGTAVVTLEGGQVCILKLHHGHRRVSLAEAEALLAS